MPDTYENKPTADQLLHDLARVFETAGLTAGPETPTGPIERIYGAVEDYKASNEWRGDGPTPDHVDGLRHVEHGAWLAICDMLRDLDIEINENDLLARTIEMWGEHLVALRTEQTREIRQRAFDERKDRLAAAQEPSDG